MAKVHVSTTINGEPMEFLCEPNDTMLDALRGPLGLTGSKEGCASGDCGACSITVDDSLVCSCLMLAVESQDHELRTIEGMAQGEKLHPLQQKFLESAALQCGIWKCLAHPPPPQLQKALPPLPPLPPRWSSQGAGSR